MSDGHKKMSEKQCGVRVHGNMSSKYVPSKWWQMACIYHVSGRTGHNPMPKFAFFVFPFFFTNVIALVSSFSNEFLSYSCFFLIKVFFSSGLFYWITLCVLSSSVQSKVSFNVLPNFFDTCFLFRFALSFFNRFFSVIEVILFFRPPRKFSFSFYPPFVIKAFFILLPFLFLLQTMLFCSTLFF